MDDLLREMIDPPPVPAEIARRRRVVSTFVILGLAGVGLTGLTTSAFFTDNDTITSNGITTGSLDITTDELVMLDSGDLTPGDSAFDEITVTNSGSLAYRYALSYRASDIDTVPGTTARTPDSVARAIRSHLSSQLRLRVYVDVRCTLAGTDAASARLDSGTASQDTGVDGSAGAADRSADDSSTGDRVSGGDAAANRTPAAADGTGQLASVGNVGGTGALSTEWAGLLGDAASGGQEGDRELSATSNEKLCVRLDLSSDAGNAFQDTSSEISLRFDAEQTTNNP